MHTLRRIIQAWALFAVCFLTSGCSMLVSRYISSQRSFDVSAVSSEHVLRDQGFSKEKFCSLRYHACLSYLVAGPLSSRKLTYDVDISVNDQTERVQLALSREQVSTPLRGTVVLLHGFRASKEFMANTALYFRFLGFEVLMPDLPGHGDSEGALGFGVKDSGPLNELLDSRGDIQQPLYVFGNSMGALAATRLATARKDVRGVILQAPMQVFDEAVLSYIQSDSPLLAKFLTERAIKDGARLALERADIGLAQTDIKPQLAVLSVAVLVLASSDDPVAPFEHFESLNDAHIDVQKIEGRSHPGMAVVASAEADIIYRWLVLSSSDRRALR